MATSLTRNISKLFNITRLVPQSQCCYSTAKQPCMKYIIEHERNKSQPEIVERYFYSSDSLKALSFSGFSQLYDDLQYLRLINVGLTTFEMLPELPNLEMLELSDNGISGGLNYLSAYPKLKMLNLSGNKIEYLEALEPLKNLKKLKHLSLINCAISTIDNYREKVFALLPHLKYLDGRDQDGKPDEEKLTEYEENFFNDNCDDYLKKPENKEKKTPSEVKKKILEAFPDDEYPFTKI